MNELINEFKQSNRIDDLCAYPSWFWLYSDSFWVAHRSIPWISTCHCQAIEKEYFKMIYPLIVDIHVFLSYCLLVVLFWELFLFYLSMKDKEVVVELSHECHLYCWMQPIFKKWSDRTVYSLKLDSVQLLLSSTISYYW